MTKKRTRQMRRNIFQGDFDFMFFVSFASQIQMPSLVLIPSEEKRPEPNSQMSEIVCLRRTCTILLCLYDSATTMSPGAQSVVGVRGVGVGRTNCIFIVRVADAANESDG